MTAFTNTSYGVKNIGTTPTPIINGVPSGTMAIASLIISNTTTAPITTTAVSYTHLTLPTIYSV